MGERMSRDDEMQIMNPSTLCAHIKVGVKKMTPNNWQGTFTGQFHKFLIISFS